LLSSPKKGKLTCNIGSGAVGISAYPKTKLMMLPQGSLLAKFERRFPQTIVVRFP